MRKRTISLAATALALGLAAVPAFAQGPHRMMRGFGGGGPGLMLDRAAVVLDLTEQQKEFARKLAADTRAQAQPLIEQLRQAREELAAAVKSNNTGNIGAITARQGNTMGQLAALRAMAMAAFYAQLTPEQKVKADKLYEQRRSRMAQFREKWQQRRGNAGRPQ